MPKSISSRQGLPTRKFLRTLPGILIAALGFAANPWVVARVFSADGILELSTRIKIWAAEFLVVAAGYALIRKPDLPLSIDRGFESYLSRFDARNRGLLKAASVALAVILIATMTALKIWNRQLYWTLIAEDGVIETLTAVAYFMAFLGAISITRALYRQDRGFYAFLYLGLSAVLLWVCLEEISYGQRIFGFTSPEAFVEYNKQAEVNIHNIASNRMLHLGFMLVGAYGALAALVVPRFRDQEMAFARTLFVPELYLAPHFVPALALFSYYEIWSKPLVSTFGDRFGFTLAVRGVDGNYFMHIGDQETPELSLAIAFLLFVSVKRWRLARNATES
jgi:hypothetical protein